MKHWWIVSIGALLCAGLLCACTVNQTASGSESAQAETTAASQTTQSGHEGAILTSDYQAAGGTEADGFGFGFGLVGYASEWDENGLTDVAKAYHDALLSKGGVYTYSDQGGDEYYVIVPKYEGTVITLDHMNTESESDKPDGEILRTDDTLFVRCNPSDLRSNVQITVRYNGEEWTFSPFISLRDGAVQTPEKARTLPGWGNDQ